MNSSVQLGRGTSRVQVQRKALRDGVFDRLVEMLLSDSLAPGTNLNIESLAREFGVSPTPVREALGQLEHTGLVSRIALRGYRVSALLTPNEIVQLNDARMIVELGALDIALKRPDTLTSLLDAAQRQHLDVVASIGNSLVPEHQAERIAAYRRFYDADWAFHFTIMQHANNRYILQMADVLGSHIHRLRQSVELGLRDMNEATAEHGRILRALQDDDPDMTMRAMRDHLAAVRLRSLADGAAEQQRHPARERA